MPLRSNLGKGADAAVPIGELAESLNLPRRSVEQMLEGLVQEGVPVVANHKGVYLAQTAQEARAYAQSLRGRIVAVQARISALERWADEQDAHQEGFPWAA